MAWVEPDLLQVPVRGGDLTVARWGTGATTVVASHGITANHRVFGEVGAQVLDRALDVSLYAVDHRGRGRSASLPGPAGLDAQARDLLALLDHLEVARGVLVGHSMGAYVVARAAEFAPAQVGAVILVDGGLPIPVSGPEDATVEDVVRAVIGPALDRLEATVASPEEYVAMWQEHPAVGGRYFTDVAAAYVRYDLVPDGARWRSPVRKDAVLEDGRSVLIDDQARTAIQRIEAPTTLLWAPRGLLDQEPGLLPPDLMSTALPDLPHVLARQVPDVNHYSILFAPRGATAVVDALAEHLG